MDPITALNCWIHGDTPESKAEYRRAYNEWVAKGGFNAGVYVHVWSNKVFGVPVLFNVSKIGTKYMHGTLEFNGVRWTGTLPRERVVGYIG